MSTSTLGLYASPVLPKSGALVLQFAGCLGLYWVLVANLGSAARLRSAALGFLALGLAGSGAAVVAMSPAQAKSRKGYAEQNGWTLVVAGGSAHGWVEGGVPLQRAPHAAKTRRHMRPGSVPRWTDVSMRTRRSVQFTAGWQRP